MAIVELAEAKAHLAITDDTDDLLISSKIDAAQAHLERWLGYEIATEYPVPPADLKEAVLQLTAHWYENREATVVGVSAALMPFSLREIISGRRKWSC